MEIRREPGKGIQGWTVRQKRGLLQAARAREERNWRDILEASQGRILRGALLVLLAWGALSAVLGVNGLLHLQALRAQEADLTQENATLAKEHAQVTYELREDPSLSMERVLREQYLKSLRNEVVIRAVPAPAPRDSAFGPGGVPTVAPPERIRQHP
jgi:cell division protein FtsB